MADREKSRALTKDINARTDALKNALTQISAAATSTAAAYANFVKAAARIKTYRLVR